MKRYIAALFFIVAGTVLPNRVMAQAPALTHALPAAVAPGQASDTVLYGANLAGATGLWHSIPGATVELTPGIEANGTKADNISYRFTLPAETPVGIYGLRLATPLGTSSLRLLMVDDLPSTADNGANKTVETAQPLALPVAVDGTCEAESFDFYKLTVVAGQRVSVEVVGRRLGSALDSVIRLLDATGRELAYSDDEAGIGADSRFEHQFAAAGDYWIEIRDIRYQGGANHRYRMRIGDFPLATTPFPMGGQKGTTPKLAVAGPSVAGLPPLSVAVPAGLDGSQLTVSAKYPTGQGSALLRLVASSTQEQVEIEPNDTPETSGAVVLPGAINGRFEVPNDRDYFQIQGKKGERFVFQGRARSLGSPSDLFMRLYKADGALLVEAEDTGADEGAINFTFPEDGIYRLMVEDLLHRGGPEHVYRVVVEPYSPGFTLAADFEKFDAPKGGVFVSKVTCARTEYNGPITLAVVGAGGGVSVANNVIPEGKNEIILSATVPATLEPGTIHTIKIVGTAKVGEADVTAEASTLVPMRTLFSGLPFPPAELDGSIGLGIGPVFPDFFKLEVEPVSFPQVTGTASFTVKATKENKFDDPITLAVDGLPAGVTATVAPIEKGKAEVAIALAGPGSLAEGDYTFRLVGSATFQNQTRQVVATPVLRVVKPIEVSAAAAGPVAPGAVQKLKITAVRHGGATAPIVVSLKDLPKGVTAPAEATIAEGQNEVEVDLTAAADAPPAQAVVTVVATIKIGEKPVVVEGLSTPVAVMAP